MLWAKRTSCIQNSGGAGEVQFNVELGGGMMQKNSKRHHWPSGSPYRPGVSYQSLQIGLENYQMCLTIAKLDNVVYLSHSTGKISHASGFKSFMAKTTSIDLTLLP